MPGFLDKALEGVSTARDFSLVLLSGGAMFLGDGATDLIPHVEPSAAALGAAAVSLGVAKAVDAVRYRSTKQDREANASAARAEVLLARARRLLVFFEEEQDYVPTQQLRRSIALYEVGAWTEAQLTSTVEMLTLGLAEAEEGLGPLA